MIKGDSIFKIGVLIFAITLFISHITNLNEGLLEFLMGFGAGLALVGSIKQFIEKRKK